MLKDNERIVFFGDSITELGIRPKGYVTLIRDSLIQQHPHIEIIGTGVSGNKVPDLLRRVDRDVIARNPTLVVMYIGINDVWHAIMPGHSGTPKDRYASGLKELIGRIKNSGAAVILCTPSVIGEKWDGSNKLDAQLEEYAAISRQAAEDTGTRICDLRKAFLGYLTTHNPDERDNGILTEDGVHLNDEGNRLVALELLKMLE